MADIEARRAHHLGLAEARRAADQMAEHLERKYGLRAAWEGNVLRFERPGLKGSLALTGEALHLSVTLGLMLRAMRASLERAVMAELEHRFPARATTPARAVRPKKAPAHPKRGA